MPYVMFQLLDPQANDNFSSGVMMPRTKQMDYFVDEISRSE